ncbi:leucine-rich repeat-containing protein 37A-like [Empidonax traillii]|uniref:leucine-rich repeat-containing protein 37A-like n=1 Tax=Empidonax traillii TaxID=164674 RepID=UPI000FFD033C|nr:leucine-rich repeat-containing protein 37A-like [Empidonax traillii]
MQFLEELILSHNPLTVIADTAFFKLPSVNYLDLSATQVTPQTLLLLLQTTVHLETLKLPSDVACCLCQEHPSTETPCRTIQFLCENLCSTSAAQCAAHTGPVAQTQGEVMAVELSKKAKSSPVLNLKPKEPSLGDHGTVTLVVSLTLSGTEGDGSSLKDSRQPQPVRENDVEEKAIVVSDQKQQAEHLNWQALNPWDLDGGLNPTEVDSDFGQQEDVEVAPSPRHDNMRTNKERKKRDTQYWVGQNPLFHQALSPVIAQGEPTGTDTKAELGLNRNLDFLSDPLVDNGPAAIIRAEARAEGEPSSQGGHFSLIPDTMETPWKQQEEGSRLLKTGGPEGTDALPLAEEVFEITGYHHLLPDEGLQTFMAQVEEALRMDCSLPGLQLCCAKMVSKTELLLSLLSKRQEKEGAFELTSPCLLEEKISRRTALEEGKEYTGEKKPEPLDDTITLVVLLSVLAVISLMLMCVLKLCSRPCAVFCRCLRTVLRSFFVILRRRWRKNKYKKLEDVEDFPELSEDDLLVVQYIMDVLDAEEEESKKEREQMNTDAFEAERGCEDPALPPPPQNLDC